ncbi:hypothetical protein GQ44DRAFT_404233 [Phaeosphaeriaceae sp. PMI808]|nr:hypothetical protein GQ44DRAFT_404233 [Phaeosphaeriaceae sp. PMI808]
MSNNTIRFNFGAPLSPFYEEGARHSSPPEVVAAQENAVTADCDERPRMLATNNHDMPHHNSLWDLNNDPLISNNHITTTTNSKHSLTGSNSLANPRPHNIFNMSVHESWVKTLREKAKAHSQSQPQSLPIANPPQPDFNEPFLTITDQECTDMSTSLAPIIHQLLSLKTTTLGNLPKYNPDMKVKSHAQIIKSRLFDVAEHINQASKNMPESERGLWELKICRIIATVYWPLPATSTTHIDILRICRNIRFRTTPPNQLEAEHASQRAWAEQAVQLQKQSMRVARATAQHAGTMDNVYDEVNEPMKPEDQPTQYMTSDENVTAQWELQEREQQEANDLAMAQAMAHAMAAEVLDAEGEDDSPSQATLVETDGCNQAKTTSWETYSKEKQEALDRAFAEQLSVEQNEEEVSEGIRQTDADITAERMVYERKKAKADDVGNEDDQTEEEKEYDNRTDEDGDETDTEEDPFA